jgi:hypothetical protein
MRLSRHPWIRSKVLLMSGDGPRPNERRRWVLQDLARAGLIRSPAGGGESHRWRSGDGGQPKRQAPNPESSRWRTSQEPAVGLADGGAAAATNATTQERQDPAAASAELCLVIAAADEATNCRSRQRTEIDLKIKI